MTQIILNLISMLVGVTAIAYAVYSAIGMRSTLSQMQRTLTETHGNLYEMHANLQQMHINLTEMHGNLTHMQRTLGQTQKTLKQMGDSLAEVGWTSKIADWKFNIFYFKKIIRESLFDFALDKALIELASQAYKLTQDGRRLVGILGLVKFTAEVYKYKPQTPPEDFLIRLLSWKPFRQKFEVYNAGITKHEEKVELGEVLGTAYVYAQEKQQSKQSK